MSAEDYSLRDELRDEMDVIREGSDDHFYGAWGGGSKGTGGHPTGGGGADIKTHAGAPVSAAREKAAADAALRDTSDTSLRDMAANARHPQSAAAKAELARRSGAKPLTSYEKAQAQVRNAKPLPNAQRPDYLRDDKQLAEINRFDTRVRPLGPKDAGARVDQVSTGGITGLVYQRSPEHADKDWRIVYQTTFGRTQGFGSETFKQYTGIDPNASGYSVWSGNLPVSGPVAARLNQLINIAKQKQ